MNEIIKKEKTEYFCPHCKKVVGFDETFGETGSFLGPGILRTQEWPKTSRYHKKCKFALVELTKSDKIQKV